ncbi:MAG TPA: dihydrodipicolinate reductase C-terminal domain-containing protein [Vicinamibacteria bacterium]|nr:dihydrodipicolinate reductase C-terminal domain-containing protein [Vicinamibacteria bacterium]
MRLLLVGHGRMGRLVESLAAAYGFEVAGVLDLASNDGGTGATAERCRGVDLAIDFSTAEATLATAPRLAAHGVSLVIGTTGWQSREAELREAVARAGIGAVVAPNFSLGANVLDALAEEAGRRLGEAADYGAFVHEAHHAAKKDAPSGTALTLRRALERGGFPRPVDVSSTRAGHIPGTHTVGFDGPAETLALVHTVRDRATFAHGALEAARWVKGRKGWFTMRDVILSAPR